MACPVTKLTWSQRKVFYSYQKIGGYAYGDKGTFLLRFMVLVFAMIMFFFFGSSSNDYKVSFIFITIKLKFCYFPIPREPSVDRRLSV